MFDSSKLIPPAVALAAIAGLISAPAASATGPHIKVVPNEVMVNQTVTLTGANFPANTTITLKDCAQKTWIVPQEPCAPEDEVTLTTNALGRFKTPFKVGLCPAPPPKEPPVTRRTCFIGAPHPFGVDEVELVGAAKVIVTFP
jgi:hypothetical protein